MKHRILRDSQGKETMTPGRRNFLHFGFSAAAAVLLPAPLLGQQRRCDGLHPPEPAQRLGIVVEQSNVPSRHPAVPRDRGQQLRTCLEQLCDCADKLRREVHDPEFADVVSVAFYKETQTLEHLAKHLKALAKG